MKISFITFSNNILKAVTEPIFFDETKVIILRKTNFQFPSASKQIRAFLFLKKKIHVFDIIYRITFKSNSFNYKI